MAKMDILMRTEQVRKDIVISISSFTQTVEQFKDKHVHCLPVKSMCLIERRFKEHSLPIVCYIWSQKLSPKVKPRVCLSGVCYWKSSISPMWGIVGNLSFWAPIWVRLGYVLVAGYAWIMFSSERAFQCMFIHSKRLRNGWVVMIQSCFLGSGKLEKKAWIPRRFNKEPLKALYSKTLW